MVTMVGKTEDTLEGVLSDLIKIDYDAVEAYEAAINRLDNNDYKTTFSNFRQDHLRHIETLGKVLREMKMNVPTGPDIKSLVTQGKVVLANLLGDKAILNAMKSNEQDTSTAYEQAVGRKFPNIEVNQILLKHLEDENRHYNWIADEVENLK